MKFNFLLSTLIKFIKKKCFSGKKSYFFLKYHWFFVALGATLVILFGAMLFFYVWQQWSHIYGDRNINEKFKYTFIFYCSLHLGELSHFMYRLFRRERGSDEWTVHLMPRNNRTPEADTLFDYFNSEEYLLNSEIENNFYGLALYLTFLASLVTGWAYIPSSKAVARGTDIDLLEFLPLDLQVMQRYSTSIRYRGHIRGPFGIIDPWVALGILLLLIITVLFLLYLFYSREKTLKRLRRSKKRRLRRKRLSLNKKLEKPQLHMKTKKTKKASRKWVPRAIPTKPDYFGHCVAFIFFAFLFFVLLKIRFFDETVLFENIWIVFKRVFRAVYMFLFMPPGKH